MRWRRWQQGCLCVRWGAAEGQTRPRSSTLRRRSCTSASASCTLLGARPAPQRAHSTRAARPLLSWPLVCGADPHTPVSQCACSHTLPPHHDMLICHPTCQHLWRARRWSAGSACASWWQSARRQERRVCWRAHPSSGRCVFPFGVRVLAARRRRRVNMASAPRARLFC